MCDEIRITAVQQMLTIRQSDCYVRFFTCLPGYMKKYSNKLYVQISMHYNTNNILKIYLLTNGHANHTV